MNRKTAIVTGATALAASAVLLAASPAAAAEAKSARQAPAFSIEAVTLPQDHTVVTPDTFACCSLFSYGC